MFAYCHKEIPRWNTISISGYHMAEAGATPVQEIAFTLSNAIAYVRAAQAAGLDVDDFAPRLSFFFVARTTLLEEVAKFRAARRIWARIMRDDFGAKNPKSPDAAVPHPDRRRAADRAAAGGQPRPRRAAGPRRGPRRHPVPAHQLVRRGHRPPDAEGRPARAAHPAGHRLRDRRDQDRRPVRRLLRRRGDDRRHRGRRARADAGGRGQGRSGRRHRGGLPEERDRAQRLPHRPRDRQQGTHHRRASTGSASTSRSPTSRCGSTPRSSATRSPGSPPCGPNATTTPSTAALDALQGRRGRHRQRALPDEGGAPPARHRRRGRPRAARGLGHLRPRGTRSERAGQGRAPVRPAARLPSSTPR